MSWADKIKNEKNGVVLVKGAAAFFVCRAKNREKANFLLEGNCFCLSPGLGKESNAIAVLYLKPTVSFLKRGAVPAVGWHPFLFDKKQIVSPQAFPQMPHFLWKSNPAGLFLCFMQDSAP